MKEGTADGEISFKHEQHGIEVQVSLEVSGAKNAAWVNSHLNGLGNQLEEAVMSYFAQLNEKTAQSLSEQLTANRS